MKGLPRGTNVSVGPASLIGYGGAVVGLITSIVLAISQNETLFTGSSSLPVKLAAGLALGTGFGRQYQAAHLPGGATVGKVAADVQAMVDTSGAAKQAEAPTPTPPKGSVRASGK